MTTSDYLRAFRRSAWLIVLITGAFTAIAVAGSLQRADQFVSEASLLLSPASSPNVNDVYVSQQIIQRNLGTYAAVVTSPDVLDPVAEDFALEPGALAEQVVADFTAPEPIITVSVVAPDQQSAQAIAQAVAEQSVAVLNAPPQEESAQVLAASVIGPASLPTQPSGPSAWFLVLGGFAVGLLIALALALLRVRLDGYIHTPEEAGTRLGLPVFGTIPNGFDAEDAEDRQAALMAAAVMAHSWSDAPRAVLLAAADSSSNGVDAARALAHGFQRLGIHAAALNRDPAGDGAEGKPRSTREVAATDAHLVAVLGLREQIASTQARASLVVVPTLPVQASPEALMLAEGSVECVLCLRSGRTTEASAKEALRILGAAGVEVRGTMLITS